MKPNRSYGGDGILLGPLMEESDWEIAIQAALKDEEDWVTQRRPASVSMNSLLSRRKAKCRQSLFIR